MTQHTPNKVDETRAKLSGIRRSGPSIAQEGRQRRTHVRGLENYLKTLPLEQKLKKNHGIEEKNLERREKHAKFEAGLEKEDGSPTASLISVASEEWNTIRRSKTLFERVKDYIPAKFLAWMLEMNDAEDEAKPGKNQPPAQRLDALDSTAGVVRPALEELIETEADPTKSRVIEIPHPLLPMASYHRYLPLPIFTDENLLFIKNNLSTFKTEKIYLPNTTEKTTILLLSDITEKLGIDRAKATSNEGLSYPKFQRAAANFFRFETERDPKGKEGNRSNWTQRHFLFWTNRPDAEDTYHIWKPREYEMRIDQQNYSTAFDINNYRLAWNRVQMTIDNQQFPAAA
ncbi:hypothetical protein F5880DRAFT_397983 [Lentinula raphanica]|nr:hypothetical protein F5880DRAFT_397983 [Lentinula raphanica]